MLAQLLSIVLPVYLCAGLGYFWVRSGRRYDTAFVTDLVMMVGAPCLTFSSLIRVGLDLDRLLGMAGAVVLATSCLALLGAGALRLMGAPLSTFLAPISFGNTGNMGIPICYFAFGDEGLALGVCFYATTALLQFTVGQWFWSGRVSFSQLAREPLAFAALAALGVIAFDVAVPAWLLRTTRLLGDFTIPLMQLTLGVSLARLELARVPRSFVVACLKLGLGACVGYALAAGLGFEGVARGVLILDCAMPVAVINYMFAARYERSPTDVASAIVFSTLLSFLSVPILLLKLL